MRYCHTLLIVIVIKTFIFAQETGLYLSPLGGQPLLHKTSRLIEQRITRPEFINLPFIEDFSNPGPYPDQNLWLDRSVFVNNTMGYRPPSVGVATFDAIRENGAPYGSFANEINWADTLTSNFINLATYSEGGGAARRLTPADSVYMSFFLQPKGYCYPPRVRDSMILEFRDSLNTWNTVGVYKVTNNTISFDSLPSFVFYFVKIENPRYFFGKFQFRFRFFTQLNSASAAWHLDYIKIAPNRRIANRTLDDVTFVEPPKPLLSRYTAMPWKQAKAALNTEVRDSFDALFFNHFAQTRNPTTTNVSVTASNGQSVITAQTIADGQAANIPPSIFYRTAKRYLTTFYSNLDRIPLETPNLRLTTEYTLNIEAQEGRDLYQVAKRNDRVSITTQLNDFYAYDDGVAEMQLGASGNNTITAVRFTANVDDKLRGFMIMFPRINANSETDRFNFRVYEADTAGFPKANFIFEQKGLRPFYADVRFDTLQGYTTYRLETATRQDTAITIKKGHFFLAWQNVGNVEIPVGFDRNNPQSAQAIYSFLSNRWVRNTQLLGAVMIRPIFGSVTPQNTNATQDLVLRELMTIYPNPAREVLNFDINPAVQPTDYIVGIFNANGQLIRQEQLRGGTLSLSELPAGFYILKIQDKKSFKTYFHKFIKEQ